MQGNNSRKESKSRSNSNKKNNSKQTKNFSRAESVKKYGHNQSSASTHKQSPTGILDKENQQNRPHSDD